MHSRLLLLYICMAAVILIEYPSSSQDAVKNFAVVYTTPKYCKDVGLKIEKQVSVGHVRRRPGRTV